MRDATPALDLLTRRLMRAIEGDLRRSIGTSALDPDLVGLLYLRVRTVLQQNPVPEKGDSIDEIVLTIYLTASTWQSRELPLDVLAALHQSIARALVAETALTGSETRRHR